MSRIGKKEIELPQEIDVTINKSEILVKGPKGNLYYEISNLIKIIKTDTTIQLITKEESKNARAIHGLSRSIINNMIIGVSTGFEKQLVIEGVGYRSQLEGKNLILNVGYSHPVKIKPPSDIAIKVDNNINISIIGINKEKVGEIAAKIRSIRPPEPYKGKGIRYINEKIRRKVGKAGK
uniref:Large ribosomal subunit protein uL6c n=1 Tax=Spermothamnion repens TaxID=31383 RepID=A0A4D6X4D8_9FLOR|nr:ribosomal protein L6 [Spermothamnion repens]